MYCENNHLNDADAVFCTDCGSRITPMGTGAIDLMAPGDKVKTKLKKSNRLAVITAVIAVGVFGAALIPGVIANQAGAADSYGDGNDNVYAQVIDIPTGTVIEGEDEYELTDVPVVPSSPLAAVSVVDDPSGQPRLQFDAPFPVGEADFLVLYPGDGELLQFGLSITQRGVAYDGRTGRQFLSTWDWEPHLFRLQDDGNPFTQAYVGLRVGARVLFTYPAMMGDGSTRMTISFREVTSAVPSPAWVPPAGASWPDWMVGTWIGPWGTEIELRADGTARSSDWNDWAGEEWIQLEVWEVDSWGLFWTYDPEWGGPYHMGDSGCDMRPRGVEGDRLIFDATCFAYTEANNFQGEQWDEVITWIRRR